MPMDVWRMGGWVFMTWIYKPHFKYALQFMMGLHFKIIWVFLARKFYYTKMDDFLVTVFVILTAITIKLIEVFHA